MKNPDFESTRLLLDVPEDLFLPESFVKERLSEPVLSEKLDLEELLLEE